MTISASTIIQDDMLPVSGLLFRRDLLKLSMTTAQIQHFPCGALAVCL
jgi:hypothetical protein